MLQQGLQEIIFPFNTSTEHKSKEFKIRLLKQKTKYPSVTARVTCKSAGAWSEQKPASTPHLRRHESQRVHPVGVACDTTDDC